MKKMLLPLATLFWRRVLLLVPFIIFSSCNSDFNINNPSRENVYVLNCILRGDTTIQYATLSKNVYTENGAKPTSGSPEQYIQGANIKIFYNNSVYVMRDTTLQIIIDGNITEVNCYYIKDLIINSGRVVSIEATTPNGKILKSTIQTPRIVFPDYPFYLPPGGYMAGYQFLGTYNWSFVVNSIASTDIISLPQLEVNYKKYEGGTFVNKKIVIPLGYLRVPLNAPEQSEFENAEPSYSCRASVFLDIINTKMKEISGNDPNKQNYIIEKTIFSVLCIDPLLSKYYSECTSNSEIFTIKLYPPESSNIEGGQGIFAMYNKFSRRLIIDDVYVQSFGYQYKPY